MADWKKILKETLKDTDGAYDKVMSAFDSEGLRLQDVSTGEYTSTKKYNDDVTKLNEEIKTLKEAPNPLADEIIKLRETHANDIASIKAKAQDVIKSRAISEKINSLGINNELEVVGLKSLIKYDDIKMDDDYNITGGLDEQIEELKKNYDSSFEKPKVVSTGQSMSTSQQVGGAKRVYSSLEEISKLSQAEVDADIDNITAQLPNLK